MFSGHKRARFNSSCSSRRSSRNSRESRLAWAAQQQGTSCSSSSENDALYFGSYAHVGIHEEMIKDRVRTETYRAAILHYRSTIQGKVVVDVGCGTGILSIFCALAGAKKVYAVDASDIAVQAAEVVKANNLSDRVIVLHGRVEEVNIEEEVDVIISEWMGYMLLYESMLSSVIIARDRWLKSGGLILPSHATLYMAPVTNAERYDESINFWRNVYGIDMSPMLPLAKQCAFEEPCIEIITGDNILAGPFIVKRIDCGTITSEELETVTANFNLSSLKTAPLHGFALWFDVAFGEYTTSSDSHLESSIDSSLSVDLSRNDAHQRKKCPKYSNSLVLSTAPEDAPTHWAQTLIYLFDPLEVKQDQAINGSIKLTQSKENSRFFNIHLEYNSGGRCFVKESFMRFYSYHNFVL
ncbi:hypothetical protein SUGI_0697540 [Cryptomeria japonica]|nr:hypothetical protein SUGI_0697540 [Cryptomeria japonica]